MRISPEKIDDIRNATDIVDLIGGFVKLKKRGKNYLGLCPFHTEKTPSFNVSSERQMYHCFGCGVGGNVFTFVMEYEKVSFIEAVRSLAEKAGIALPVYSSDQESAASEQEELYQICREAGLFFYKSLTETQEGKLALEYFRTVRGFTDETIRTFGLGYSPNSWDAFLKFAEEKKFKTEQVEKAGLVRRREDSSYYDYFRGRAMFPVFSPTGRVVGFGARKLREDDPVQGKYINSPETLIYNKSKLLYGIYQSKEDIREKDVAILVEGYADLISVFQSGIRNIVASSGTALTQEQIQLIARYTKNITIVYDADSAGSKAALRGVDLILENDLDVRVARLPDGEDPDSFVKKFGANAFRKLLDEAVSFVDFIAQAYEREGKFQTPEGQAQVVRTIVQTIAKMRYELKRNFYIKQVADKYGLYESTLYRELEKHIDTNRRERRGENVSDTTSQNRQTSNEEIHSVSLDIPASERDLIHAMLDGGEEVIRLVFERITVSDFTHPIAKSLAMLFIERTEDGFSLQPSDLVDGTDDQEVRKLILQLTFNPYPKVYEGIKGRIESVDPSKLVIHYLRVFQSAILKRELERNQSLLKEATQNGEDISSYLERNSQLVTALKELESQARVLT
ncbi:MAG: DNA primase [Ignavibacteriae bacterium]|nr:DNA primase [Ignavibacteriota bacterium]